LPTTYFPSLKSAKPSKLPTIRPSKAGPSLQSTQFITLSPTTIASDDSITDTPSILSTSSVTRFPSPLPLYVPSIESTITPESVTSKSVKPSKFPTFRPSRAPTKKI
jgi:hypothetical protein